MTDTGEDPRTGGCWIPPWVYHDPELTMAQKVVAGRIEALSNDRGYCFASNAYLAEDLDLSESQVKRHLRNLERAGHLRRQVLRDRSGVVTERRLYPSNPAHEGQERTSAPTPPDPECIRALEGGAFSRLRGVRKRAVELRGTAVKRLTKEAGAHDGENSDSEQRSSEGPEVVDLPIGADPAAGFETDCEDCVEVASDARNPREACREHYIPTHERGREVGA